MNNYVLGQRELKLSGRDIVQGDDLQTLWHLESGALRVDVLTNEGNYVFDRLVLPGDVVGIENLVEIREQRRVRALTPSCLQQIHLSNEGQTRDLLIDAFTRIYQRTREFVTFRTGTTDARVRRLLIALCGSSLGDQPETAEFSLPSLSDIAAIVDAAPESVSRTLANLRQTEFLRDRCATVSKFNRLGNRPTRLRIGVTLRPAI
jgi:CRP-like cAMP-binding protein